MAIMKEGMVKLVRNDYFHKKGGWKLHLSVPKINHQFVYEWLESNCSYSFKYGSNSGQSGKDFTIYIGSWDEAESFSELIERGIGEGLNQIHGDASLVDLPIKHKIGARFDTTYPEFHQYGIYGIPYLVNDVYFIRWRKKEFQANKKEHINQFVTNSFNRLIELYGSYFRGNRNQVTKIIIRFLNSL